MSLLGWMFRGNESQEYNEGYHAAGEFVELVGDQELTDEQANAQWDTVESGHSQEYVRGYADYHENSTGFFKWLLKG